jgi:ABC-type antimicrobial peptide transport system permease subunit
MKGFMTKQFEANGALQQVRVSPQTDITWEDHGGNCQDCVKITDDTVSKIQKVPHVTAVARQIQLGEFEALSFGGQKLRLQQVTAYDANGVLTNTILAGRDIESSDTSGVIALSSDYADKLGYKGNYQALVGQKVSLISQNFYSGVGADVLIQYKDMQQFFSANPGADGREYQPPPTTLTATIVGIMESSEGDYVVRIPMEWARGMKQMQSYTVTQADQEAASVQCRNRPGPCNVQAKPTLTVTDGLAKEGYSGLVAKVDQASNASSVTTEIKKLGVGAADAQSFISGQLAIFNIVGAVLGGIGGISLAVAAVGVINTMVMAILERTREIGVMRAVGARRSAISRLFTFEAALLGFIGGALGVLVGYGLTFVANPLINKQLQVNNITNSNIITLPVWLIAAVIASTTLIGMLAGLYPARRAAKLDPVEALRYE